MWRRYLSPLQGGKGRGREGGGSANEGRREKWRGSCSLIEETRESLPRGRSLRPRFKFGLWKAPARSQPAQTVDDVTFSKT